MSNKNNVPKSYKKGLVNCLEFRAWKLCSSYVLFHSEILFVKELPLHEILALSVSVKVLKYKGPTLH